MIDTIKTFFSQCLSVSTESESNIPLEDRLQLATAALLIEMVHADFDVSEDEESALIEAMRKGYNLDDEKLEEIVTLAHQEKRDATSLYSFTRLINDHYSEQQKLEVIRLLWKVAYADQHFDKHELHLMRKISDLLYIPREVAMGMREEFQK